MQNNGRDVAQTSEENSDGTLPTSQEELVDQLAVKVALIVLCVAVFMAALWLVKLPSFEKCSALNDPSQRHACYDDLRGELLKPPAK